MSRQGTVVQEDEPKSPFGALAFFASGGREEEKKSKQAIPVSEPETGVRGSAISLETGTRSNSGWERKRTREERGEGGGNGDPRQPGNETARSFNKKGTARVSLGRR